MSKTLINLPKALFGSLFALTVSMSSVSFADAAAIRSGFDSSTLPRNDDESTGSVSIGFDVNYFGTTYSNTFVNNNGNITFGSELNEYTPFGLTGATSIPIIAAFFADVDTRNLNSGVVQYGNGNVSGFNAFGVSYRNVGYYEAAANLLNSFQLLLVNRSDTGLDNFDIEFNYDQIQWETSSASDGVDGFGGTSAAVGYSNGSGASGTSFQLPGSFINGALLDGGSASLIANSINSDVLGRYTFEVRGGQVLPTAPRAVPVPAGFLAPVIFGAWSAFSISKKNRNKIKSAS